MERRTALATAGAITATVLTAAIALGANLGLFGLANAQEGPGHLKLVDTPKSRLAHTEVVDVPVPVAAPSSGAGSSSGSAGSSGAPAASGSPAYSAPASTSSSPAYDDDPDPEHYDDGAEPENEPEDD